MCTENISGGEVINFTSAFQISPYFLFRIDAWWQKSLDVIPFIVWVPPTGKSRVCVCVYMYVYVSVFI